MFPSLLMRLGECHGNVLIVRRYRQTILERSSIACVKRWRWQHRTMPCADMQQVQGSASSLVVRPMDRLWTSPSLRQWNRNLWDCNR